MIAAVLMLDVFALVGGKVHTMVDGSAASAVTIVIDGERILAVGPQAEIPTGARRIELDGLHVIPGLLDGYAYHDTEHDLLYSAAGVTFVRDHGNDLGRIFEMRERRWRDATVGPSLNICGAVIDGVPPSTSMALAVRTPAEAQAALETLVAEQVDFVAIHPQLSVECWTTLCAKATEQKLVVWGPRLPGSSLAEALAGGQRGFVMLDALLPKGANFEQLDLGALDGAVAQLVQAHAAIVPALRAYAHLLEDPGDAPAELGQLGPQFAGVWSSDLAQRRASFTAEQRRRCGVVVGRQHQLLSMLYRAGAELVPGSGAPHPWLMPGEGLVRELGEWQSAGIPAGECLAFATARAARTLGVGAERGTLEAGKLADLVVLRGDPTANIDLLREVEYVVLRGRLLERAALDQRLAERKQLIDAAKQRAVAPLEVAAPTLPEGTTLLSGRVETQTPAGRIAAERWAIVREVDDTLTFCGRQRVLAHAGEDDRLVETRQRVRKGALDSFEVRVSTGKNELLVKGLQVANQWRVERRANGAFVDNKAARETLAAVDCGSVTTLLLLAHTRGNGPFPVVRFYEGLELEVVRWTLELDEDGGHKLATPSGWRFAGFEENGALKAVVEQEGQALVQTTNMELDLHGGAGLPLPEAKLALMRRARQAPVEASGGDK